MDLLPALRLVGYYESRCASTEFASQKTPPPPPPVVVNKAEEQEIDAIINSRERRGHLEYLVHWRGFPREEREWKRDSELPNAQDAIAQFHRLHPTAPRPHPTMRLRAHESDSPCVCPICRGEPLPTPSPLFLSPDFVAFRDRFARFPASSFETPLPASVDVSA